MPQLFIVDGGKPQVSTISKLLAQKNVPIPVIGLAKRWEHIVIPTLNGFTEVSLSRSRIALKLMQQMRDEAHRFAITYHRSRRNKDLIKK